MVDDLLEIRNEDEQDQGNYNDVTNEVLEIGIQILEQVLAFVVFINSMNLAGKNIHINTILAKTRVNTDLEQSVYAFISI